MNCIRSLILVSVLFISFCHDAYSQEENDEGLTYHIDRQITFGHGQNPLWLNANKYGLSSIKDDNGFIKGGITGQTVLGNSGDWWLKYGADLAVAYNFSSTLIIQQLYGDLQFRKLTLSVGSKQRKAQLKNNELSSGGQTFGINARPIPEISLETPEYVNILKDNNLIGLKFRFGYGMTTDWRWQRHFAAEDTRYTSRHWLHNQALYLRVGDEERFPLVYEGGFEWSNQFGGTIHNYNQTDLKRIKMHQRFKDFFKAIVNERAWEFGGEGLRKFDLVRWNLYANKIEEAMRTMLCWGISSYMTDIEKDEIAFAKVMSEYPDVSKYANWANKLWYAKAGKANKCTDIKWFNTKYKVEEEDAVMTANGWQSVNWGSQMIKRTRTYSYKGVDYGTDGKKTVNKNDGTVTYTLGTAPNAIEFTINSDEPSGVSRKDVYQASDYATRLYRGYSNGALKGNGVAPYILPIGITTLNASGVLNNDGYCFNKTEMGEGINVDVTTIITENW